MVEEANKIQDPGLWQDIKPDGLAESNQACQSVTTSPASATDHQPYSHQTNGEPALSRPKHPHEFTFFFWTRPNNSQNTTNFSQF